MNLLINIPPVFALRVKSTGNFLKIEYTSGNEESDVYASVSENYGIPFYHNSRELFEAILIKEEGNYTYSRILNCQVYNPYNKEDLDIIEFNLVPIWRCPEESEKIIFNN